MADFHNINDYMARVCDCGCARFYLLRSGAIECDDCRLKQENIIWGDDDSCDLDKTVASTE